MLVKKIRNNGDDSNIFFSDQSFSDVPLILNITSNNTFNTIVAININKIPTIIVIMLFFLFLHMFLKSSTKVFLYKYKRIKKYTIDKKMPTYFILDKIFVKYGNMKYIIIITIDFNEFVFTILFFILILHTNFTKHRILKQ